MPWKSSKQQHGSASPSDCCSWPYLHITEAIAPYWKLSAAFLKAEVKKQILTPTEREKHARSLTVHTKVGEDMWNHDLEAMALSFRKL